MEIDDRSEITAPHIPVAVFFAELSPLPRCSSNNPRRQFVAVAASLKLLLHRPASINLTAVLNAARQTVIQFPSMIYAWFKSV